jgi:pSer/pThr/pTyr-binding forkhead associated (FHA) protein
MSERIRVRVGDRAVMLSGTEVVIGRSPYCTLVLDNASISRVHATIRRVGNKVYISDNVSRNGTFVNSKRVGSEPVLIGPNDQITVGREKLHLDVFPAMYPSDTLAAPASPAGPAAPQDETASLSGATLKDRK